MKKRYAISDIHGNAYQFLKLLDHVDPDPAEMVILGDFINVGFDVWGVIEEIDQLVDEGCTLLMGNHEEAYMKTMNGQMSSNDFLYSSFMGITTVRSLELARVTEGEERVNKAVAKVLNKLQMYHEDGDHIFVHAGIDPRIPYMDQQKRDVLLYGCQSWKDPAIQHSFDEYIVYGHTPTYYIHRGITEEEPTVWMSHRAKKIAIDTGAGFGRRLTMIDLQEGIAYAYDFSKRGIVEYQFKRKGRYK